MRPKLIKIDSKSHNKPKEDLNSSKEIQNEPEKLTASQNDPKGELTWPKTTQNEIKQAKTAKSET